MVRTTKPLRYSMTGRPTQGADPVVKLVFTPRCYRSNLGNKRYSVRQRNVPHEKKLLLHGRSMTTDRCPVLRGWCAQFRAHARFSVFLPIHTLISFSARAAGRAAGNLELHLDASCLRALIRSSLGNYSGHMIAMATTLAKIIYER